MAKPIIRLVITDLDNTLYDWVTFFAYALYEMVNEAAHTLRVERERLLDDLRLVHQKYGNSEYPFALVETRSAAERFPGHNGEEITRELRTAFQRFEQARHQKLALYPGVSATLRQLHEQGTLIVGHTEATTVNAIYRLTKLGIAERFTRLYAQAAEGEDRVHIIWDTILGGQAPEVAHLKRTERKPNPQIVKSICDEMGVPVNETLYVGDSIVSDIGMAKEAGAWAAWAEYGTHYDPVDWERLVRITHWTKDDVRRVKLAKERYGGLMPDAILRSGLSDIFTFFDFSTTVNRTRTTNVQEGRPLSSRNQGHLPVQESDRRHAGGA